jgi:hypothetical protein
MITTGSGDAYSVRREGKGMGVAVTHGIARPLNAYYPNEPEVAGTASEI